MFSSLIVWIYLRFSECIFLCSGDGDFDFPDPKGVQDCIQCPPLMLWGYLWQCCRLGSWGSPVLAKLCEQLGVQERSLHWHLLHHHMRVVRFVCLVGAIPVCFWLLIIKEFLKERYNVIQTIQYNTNTFKTELGFFWSEILHFR